MRRLLAPEVVQSSALDCGPAALKSLLGGFGIPVSYGRLREACQTGLDGSSIDTLEAVANLLGLEAEQVMQPADHVTLPETKALPAIAVITLPGGFTHFVVVWRRHGDYLQIMDPALGRRWVRSADFERELYRHTAIVPASGWREFAGTADFQAALLRRLRGLGMRQADAEQIRAEANSDESWKSLGRLDAAIRAVELLRGRSKLKSGEAGAAVRALLGKPEAIPPEFWIVRETDSDEEGSPQVMFAGAILVRAVGLRRKPVEQPLPPELALASEQHVPGPFQQLWALVHGRDRLTALLLVGSVPLATLGLLVETFLFRSLFDIAGQLHLAGQRMGAITALVLFSVFLLFLEAANVFGTTRFARHLELRVRLAFLQKVPRLGDRYFQSRLLSDMGERSHLAHRLRSLPEWFREALATVTELLATAGCIVWLEPVTAPFVVFAVLAASVPSLLSRSVLAEGDLRTRTHNAGLTRYYLDAVLGFSSIRAHGAEQNLRRSHGQLLGEWIGSAVRLQRTVVAFETIQTLATFGAIAAMFVFHPLAGTNAGRLLLVAYWALRIPTLGQTLGILARQYPAYRSLALRVCEPLGAPEDSTAAPAQNTAQYESAPQIVFEGVSAEASGHAILTEIDLTIQPGTHVAIIGRSGAGKSSLVGMLLGWLGTKSGRILIDGSELDVARMRASTAWLDPAVQLWNRSLYDNLRFGSTADATQVGQAAEAALLRGVLQELPAGMQTRLGESGARLSGGEGQRTRLGRAILRESSSVILLDEPFRGLDREVRSRMLQEARERWRGRTLLCVTHDLAETRFFDSVVVMEGGRIVEHGTPEELRNRRGSRYTELLQAEREVRSWLWNGRPWRRIRVHRGIVEDSTAAVRNETVPSRPEAEVA